MSRFGRVHRGHWEWHRIPTSQWNHRQDPDRVQVYGESCLSALNRPQAHLDWYDEDAIGFGVSFGTEGCDPVIGIDFEVRLSGWLLKVAIWISGWRRQREDH